MTKDSALTQRRLWPWANSYLRRFWSAVFSVAILLCFFLFGAWLGLAKESKEGKPPEPPPQFRQPIEFSHKIHVEKSKTPCELCHIYARRSTVSGVPPMSLCYGCHKYRLIPGSDDRVRKAIFKLLEIEKQGRPIKWKKIYDLPDHIYFSHKRHIQVGMDCTDCHGEIFKHDTLSMKTMITDLSMGWCLKCHKEGLAAADGKIIGPFRETRGGTVLSKASTMPEAEILRGPTDCYACHK